MSLDPVTVEFSYESEDVDRYQTIANRRSAARMGTYGDLLFVTMFIVASLAIAAGLFAFWLGAVHDIRNPTVTVLCFSVFYAGRFLEMRYSRRVGTRAWREDAAVALRRSITIVVDADGVASSSSRQRHWYAWSSVKDVTSRDGLIVFWIHSASGVPLPRRLLSDEEAERVVAFARANRDEKA